jgi:8-oxo-dGTP pyrophosphatase MutT (NUDIX family)
MRTIQREIVFAVLFSKDGKILQALQTPGGRGVYPGCWGIIGGGVDQGEDHRAALNREFLEETGIDISIYPVEFIDESKGKGEKTLKGTGERVLAEMNFHTYKIVMADKAADEVKVVLDDEHSEYRWTELAELKHLKLTPPSVDLFTKLGYL